MRVDREDRGDSPRPPDARPGAKLRRCFLATEAPEAIRRLTAQVDSARADVETFVERIPTTMVMQELPAPRPTHVLIRGQYDQPGPGSSPACRARSRLARGTEGRSAGTGPLAGRSGQPADGAGGGQPRLADALRHRAGEDGRRLRRAGRAAQPSRAARLAGRRVHPVRLGRQGAAPADGDQRDVPAVVAVARPKRLGATPRTACWRGARGSGCRRR